MVLIDGCGGWVGEWEVGFKDLDWLGKFIKIKEMWIWVFIFLVCEDWVVGGCSFDR